MEVRLRTFVTVSISVGVMFGFLEPRPYCTLPSIQAEDIPAVA